MRDFRLPNVLTRHGVKGDYVVVDMEYAGPDCTEWSLDLLDKWDASTLNQVNCMTPYLKVVVVSVARNVSMSTTVLSLQALLEFPWKM